MTDMLSRHNFKYKTHNFSILATFRKLVFAITKYNDNLL